MENVPSIRNDKSPDQSIERIHKYLIGLKQEIEYNIEMLSQATGEVTTDLKGLFEDKLENVVNAIETNKEYWDRIKDITNNQGKVITEKLEGDIRTSINKILNGTSTFQIDEQGILMTDKPTEEESTWAMRLGAEGFMIAGGKTVNAALGTWSWDWKTFGTGKGFTADDITAGTLSAITLNACTLLATVITSGSITGVDISGCNILGSNYIKIGDVDNGNYIEVSPNNPVKVWKNKILVASLGYSSIGGGNLTIYDLGGKKAFHIEVLAEGNLQMYVNSDSGYIPDPDRPGFSKPNPNARYLRIDSGQVLFNTDSVGYITGNGTLGKFQTQYNVANLISSSCYDTSSYGAVGYTVSSAIQSHIWSYHSGISDERLKSDISYLTSEVFLDFCESINPATFYITSDETKRERIGLIAQDIMNDEVGKHFVRPIPGNEDYYMIDYELLSVAALGAIKEMKSKYAILESRIAKLEKGE